MQGHQFRQPHSHSRLCQYPRPSSIATAVLSLAAVSFSAGDPGQKPSITPSSNPSTALAPEGGDPIYNSNFRWLFPVNRSAALLSDVSFAHLKSIRVVRAEKEGAPLPQASSLEHHSVVGQELILSIGSVPPRTDWLLVLRDQTGADHPVRVRATAPDSVLFLIPRDLRGKVTNLGIAVSNLSEIDRAEALQQAIERGYPILPNPEVGKPFPFTLSDAENPGIHVRSKDLVAAGQTVVIEGWATWCGSCQVAIRELREWYLTRSPETQKSLTFVITVHDGPGEKKIAMALKKVKEITEVPPEMRNPWRIVLFGKGLDDAQFKLAEKLLAQSLLGESTLRLPFQVIVGPDGLCHSTPSDLEDQRKRVLSELTVKSNGE